MPLLPGKNNVGYNIKEMEKAGHPRDQSIAAALKEAGESNKYAKEPIVYSLQLKYRWKGHDGPS